VVVEVDVYPEELVEEPPLEEGGRLIELIEEVSTY
jgi:hypothetical protein